MPTPAYRLTLNGADITPRLQGRLIRLTLTDNRGFEADQLDIELDDGDDAITLPPRGATIALQLGWAGQSLEDKGTYIVDELEHTGAPDRLTITARSAELRTGLTTKRQKSWHGHTLGDIVRSIATANALTPAIAAALANVVIDHIDQADESDANLLTRLAIDNDAIATVKAGRLLFIRAGGATTAGGTALDPVTLTRADGDRHRYHVADRAGYTAVQANYHDRDSATQQHVLVGAETIDSTEQSPNEPTAGNTKTLRHIYASRANALRAARAEWQRLQRGVATCQITLATGRVDLFPEIPVRLSGFKTEIDAADWIITRATHSLDDNGLITALDLEFKPDSNDPDITVPEDPGGSSPPPSGGAGA